MSSYGRARKPRESAYADLLAGLNDLRQDPATARFDELVAQAVESGRLDPATARELRWWQRESLRGQADHLRRVASTTLAVLDVADDEVMASSAQAHDAWATASGEVADGARDDVDPAAQPTAPPAQPSEGRAEPSAVSPLPPSMAPPSAPAAPGPTPRAAGRHAAPYASSDDATGVVAPQPAAPDEPDPQAPMAPARSARRRRLLVAGLTVLPDDD